MMSLFRKLNLSYFKKNINFSYWRSTIIFAAINISALIIIILILLVPIFSFFSERSERISEQANILSRYESVASQESEVESYSKKVSENNVNGELITGSSEGIANANLQDTLKSLAEQTHISVKSLQNLPKKNIETVSLIGAKIEVSGTFENTYSFCKLLEDTSPSLLINNATIVSLPLMQPENNAAQEINTQLDIYAGAIIRSEQ